MSIDPALVAALYEKADASRWGLDEAVFAAALERSLAKAPPGGAPQEQSSAASYLRGLHLKDLALARACELGHESAWNHFVLEFRPPLYRAADAIAPHGAARELADTLYGDLFGLQERAGERQSLFRYFHGRSSLATWLRALLAQRQVDRIRATRRSDPLPDDESPAALRATAPAAEPERRRYLQMMRNGLTRAIGALALRDRLRLACYYAQELTLAQTGRVLDEHEATTSRQLARTRNTIRQAIERELRDEQGFSEAQVEHCFELVSADAGPLSLEDLLGQQAAESGPDGRAEPPPRHPARKKAVAGRSTKEDMA